MSSLPFDHDLEQAVLGAILLERDCYLDVADILSTGVFHDLKHQSIYEAIQALSKSSMPIDLLTVVHWLRNAKKLDAVGGASYISQLTNKVSSAHNIIVHSRLLQEYTIRRQLIQMGDQAKKKAIDDNDAFELLSEVEKKVLEISKVGIKQEYEALEKIMPKVIERVEQAHKAGESGGLKTGFERFDHITLGLQPSALIIIAARPAMGKTALAVSLMINVARMNQRAVALFSLEMPKVELAQRILANVSSISAKKLKKGDLEDTDWKRLSAKEPEASALPILIDDTAGLSVFELRSKCRRLKAQHDIGLVVVDYLQLMSSGEKQYKGNREQEISYISRSLKEIAKELEIPVIALSQLSRGVDARADKRPCLADLRESGAIEQDADMVTFLYRPEYYDIYEDEEGNPTHGVGEVIIAKHRAGDLGNVRLRFLGQYTRFENLEPF